MNDSLKINAASDRSHDPNRVQARGRTLRTVSHVLGVLSLIWSLIAWAEWFLFLFFILTMVALYPTWGSHPKRSYCCSVVVAS